jgi:hypothetical protein
MIGEDKYIKFNGRATFTRGVGKTRDKGETIDRKVDSNEPNYNLKRIYAR